RPYLRWIPHKSAPCALLKFAPFWGYQDNLHKATALTFYGACGGCFAIKKIPARKPALLLHVCAPCADGYAISTVSVHDWFW
ncbi:MAG: hypothetical protein RR194_02340, partial [Ruthenibacterium sp.]